MPGGTKPSSSCLPPRSRTSCHCRTSLGSSSSSGPLRCGASLCKTCARFQQQTLRLCWEQQLIGLDYNQVLFAAHPFNQMEWRRSSHGGRWGMVDTASGSRPSVVHWNGPAHWCKTAAGGFGHNFISDYQRAALRVVGFWHTPLSASRHFASQDICVLRSRIVAGTAMRCKLSSCSAVGRCRYTKTSQAEKRDWPQNGNMGVRVGRLVLCCVPR